MESERTSGRRGVILQAALELFATRGYRGTTMADIGEAAGIRGPSIYKHFESKHAILAAIMIPTMADLVSQQDAALAAGIAPSEQLRRLTEVHTRFHMTRRYESFVGNREIHHLEEPHRSHLLDLRARYEGRFRTLIEAGCRAGAFHVESPKLAAYSIIDMGVGLARWYQPSGEIGPEDVVRIYGEIALRLVRADEPAG
jgi:AcrR family transcriptional regulator